MNHISTTPFGRRRVTAGLLAAQVRAKAPCPTPGADKWEVFHDLRVARARYGVSDRDLTVLNALLSFLPDRELVDGENLIVFPSNVSLSDRAHGMAESTLRRHLAALVNAGLILRHDSPNGKRYAARGAGGELVRAFGFDLRPLLVLAGEIHGHAEAVRVAEREYRMKREACVLMLRDLSKLLEYMREAGLPGDWTPFEERAAGYRRILRRKLAPEDLEALTTEVRDELSVLTARIDGDKPGFTSPRTEEMDGNGRHSERHLQNSKPDDIRSELCLEKSRAGGEDSAPIPLSLGLVLKACPDILPYARHPVRDWRDLVGLAGEVRSMMGISADAWAEAQDALGPEVAAVTTAAILQRVDHIRRPGGYLRALSEKGRTGGFSPGPMIMALLSTNKAA